MHLTKLGVLLSAGPCGLSWSQTHEASSDCMCHPSERGIALQGPPSGTSVLKSRDTWGSWAREAKETRKPSLFREESPPPWGKLHRALQLGKNLVNKSKNTACYGTFTINDLHVSYICIVSLSSFCKDFIKMCLLLLNK